MIVVADRPPVADKCEKLFGVEYSSGTVAITYGERVHIASGQLPDYLVDHEETHVIQQTTYPGGAEAWWDRYFIDPEFRVQQEIEAYRNQYSWAKSHIKNKNEVFKMLQHCAKALSGPMYGKAISYLVAVHEIRKG